MRAEGVMVKAAVVRECGTGLSFPSGGFSTAVRCSFPDDGW